MLARFRAEAALSASALVSDAELSPVWEADSLSDVELAVSDASEPEPELVAEAVEEDELLLLLVSASSASEIALVPHSTDWHLSCPSASSGWLAVH